MAPDIQTRCWRAALRLLAGVNVCLFVTLTLRGRRSGDAGTYERAMGLLAIPYVFQTTWRCIFVSEYVDRKTMSNHPLNSVLLARLLAALGEFCFGLQLALALHAATAGSGDVEPLRGFLRPGNLALWLVALDSAGQCCATYGTIARSNLPFLLEGLAWTAMFMIAWILAVCPVSGSDPATRLLPEQTRQFLRMVPALTTPALAYMVFAYCPLCYRAWREEVKLAQGRSKKADDGVEGDDGLGRLDSGMRRSLKSQAWEALTMRVPTQKWEDWQSEWMWQTLYFSIGTWCSLWLMAYPPLPAVRSF